MKIRVEVGEYQQAPPWYYGYGYRQWDRCTAYFYIMPLNWIVWVGKWIEKRWNRLRYGQPWFDRRDQKIYNDGVDRGKKDMETSIAIEKAKLHLEHRKRMAFLEKTIADGLALQERMLSYDNNQPEEKSDVE